VAQLALALLLACAPLSVARAERASPAAPRAPFLWRIDGPAPAYLFGTIHLPDPRLFPLPRAVQSAFDSADVVYTEIDMAPETQRRALGHLLLPGNETLRRVLPPPLYERLAAYLAAHGGTIDAVLRLKVWAAAATLPQLAYAERFRRGEPPLDLFLFNEARLAGKDTAALETIEMQVAAMESQGRAGEIALLRETLEQLEAADRVGENPIDELIVAYLAGDAEQLLALANADVRSDSSRDLMKRLLDGRNRTMATEIQRSLGERPDDVHFFAAGALHFPGEAGIVALLLAQGLKVERVAR
jgi:hypothetical protein